MNTGKQAGCSFLSSLASSISSLIPLYPFISLSASLLEVRLVSLLSRAVAPSSPTLMIIYFIMKGHKVEILQTHKQKPKLDTFCCFLLNGFLSNCHYLVLTLSGDPVLLREHYRGPVGCLDLAHCLSSSLRCWTGQSTSQSSSSTA